MKKFLLSICCCALAAVGAQAETKTYTYDFSDATKWVTEKGGTTNVPTSSSNKLSAFYYAETGDAFDAGSNGYFNTSGYFLWGKSGAYIQLPTYDGEAITNVTATSSSGHSTSVNVGIYSGDTEVVAATTWSTNSSEYSYDIPADYQSSVLRLQVTNSKNSQLVKIVITTEASATEGPVLVDPEITWSESSAMVILGEEFTAPTLTNNNNLTVAYASSDAEVATVDATTGAVTILAPGTTTISASWEATETYKAGSASYSLNVVGTVASLTDFISAAPTTNTQITGAVTVYYQSADQKYTFITDGTSNLAVYQYGFPNVYANGDQLTGVIGTLGAYKNMPQMTPVADSFGTATAGTTVAPKAATLTDEFTLGDYVVFSGINVTSVSGKNCTLTDANGNTYAGYNQFNITLEETEKATVVAIAGVYSSNNQMWIVSVEGEPAEPEIPTVATLTDFITAAPTTNTQITGAVTVYYQSSDKKYTFITDGTSNLQVYAASGLTNSYNNGDQLTGIIGTMSAYGGMSQLVPDDASFGTATAGTPVEPKAATLADEIAPCDFVTLSGISVSSVSGKNATLSDGTNTLAAYDRFALGLTEVENATVVGIGAVYNENKQLYVVSVTTEGGETPDVPEITTEGDGTQANPYTVADVIALGNPGTTAQWVTGIIVGVMNYVDGTGNVFSATELTTNSNIVIAATAADFGTNYVAVQLPSGTIRDDLNLVDRPGNLGKEVSVCGDLIKYCSIAGVKNTSDYTIVGGLAPLPVGETESLTTFVEEQFSSNTKITGTVTVYYQSADKKYTFITDGTTNLEVFNYNGLEYAYTNGDQLTGIIGKFSYYQNMPQMTPQVESFGEPNPGTAVQPVETTLSNVNPADYVMIKNATISSEVVDEKTVITVSDASGSRVLFDRFSIGVADATNVNILGIGAVYGETAQLFPIEITPVEDGINEIIAEGNAATGIYDLQGRKLNAPVRGINIINGRKVLVK